MIVVTGGAGFIGSCIVKTLNRCGYKDIVIVDDIADSDKWMNMRNKQYKTYIHKNVFLSRISDIGEIEAIIHMGAQSSTLEKNFDYLWMNNFQYTKKLWMYCADKKIPFIYASSAATYGGGERGFDDNLNIDELRPLNGYGYSKQLFDSWVKHHAVDFPSQYVGLKFFNVYGPNEYFKGAMSSMVYHGYKQITSSGEVRLFKSYNPEFADGGQLRDFIYVKDVCSVIMWFLNHKNVSGLYNLGTGKARSFKELAEATFQAMGEKVNIKYIDMPADLREKYQYFTQANMEKLRSVGCDVKFMDIEQGINDYVINYLEKDFEIY